MTVPALDSNADSQQLKDRRKAGRLTSISPYLKSLIRRDEQLDALSKTFTPSDAKCIRSLIRRDEELYAVSGTFTPADAKHGPDLTSPAEIDDLRFRTANHNSSAVYIDNISSARGILLGVVIGTIMWAGLGLLVFRFF